MLLDVKLEYDIYDIYSWEEPDIKRDFIYNFILTCIFFMHTKKKGRGK